jgi:hypothetical protein
MERATCRRSAAQESCAFLSVERAYFPFYIQVYMNTARANVPVGDAVIRDPVTGIYILEREESFFQSKATRQRIGEKDSDDIISVREEWTKGTFAYEICSTH